MSLHAPVSQSVQGNTAVALSGHRALVGATFTDFASNVEFQAAKLFDTTTGNTLASFSDPLPLLDGVFASEVALTDSHALIAKTRRNGTFGSTQLESVFVYDFQGNYQRQIVSPNSDLLNGTGFGSALASHGNLVLIGAPNEQTSGNRKGAAYLVNASTGQILQRFESPLPGSSIAFGRSVAMNAGRIAIGDPQAAADSEKTGAVFEYDAATFQLISTAFTPVIQSSSAGTIGEHIAAGGDRLLSTVNYGGTKLVVPVLNGTVNGSGGLQRTNSFNSGIHSVATDGQSDAVGYSGGNLIVVPSFDAQWSVSDGFPRFSRPGENYFGTEISVDRGRVLVGSALSGKAYILESFDEFFVDTTSAPAGVTDFVMRRSGDMLELVNQNDLQQVITSRALNSTSSIRITGPATDRVSLDASLDLQLPYLQRKMPIAISNVALTLTGGSVGDTHVTMNGSDRMSILVDSVNPLRSTIEYQGSNAVTNLTTPSTLSISMADSSNHVAIRDTGSTDDRLVNLIDNATNRTLLPYVFQLPYLQLNVNTGHGGDVVDLGLLPNVFTGRIDVHGGNGNDTLNSAVRPTTPLSFDGGSGSNRLNIESSSSVTWSINGPDSGFVEQTLFSNTGTIGGGTQSDVFQFFPDGNLSGSVDGRFGTNVIDYTQVPATAVSPLFFSLSTARGSQFNGTFSQIQRVIGPTSAEATLTGRDFETSWIIDSANAGVLNMSDSSTFRFENFSRVFGGSSNDTFRIGTNGSLGRVFGGSGTDTLSYEALNVPVDINLRTTAGSRLQNGFDGIEAFVGGSQSDEITGPAQSSTWSLGGTVGMLSSGVISDNSSANTWMFDSFESFGSSGASDTLIGTGFLATWTIDGGNSGNINDTVSFTGFENLTGGGGTNIFIIDQATGSLTGVLDGGPGLSGLDYASWNSPVTIDRKLGTAPGIGGFTRLTGATGTSLRDRLTGKDQESTWTLTGLTDGMINDGFEFTSFDELSGGSATDTLVGLNGSQIWTIDQPNAGTVGTMDFAGFENLTGGTSADQFNLLPSGALSGKLDGGGGTDTLSYATWASPIEVEQRLAVSGGNITGSIGSRANGLVGGFAGIESIVGGAGTNDTVTGHDEFLINGVNAGIVNPNTISALSYTGFENLAGTSWEASSALPRDRFYTKFRFVDGGSVSGNVDGGRGPGRLDYSGYSGLVVEIDLADFTAPLIGGRWSNISGFTGSNNLSRIRATNDDATWFFSDQSNLSRDVAQVIYSPLGHEFDVVRSFTGFNDIKAGNGNDTFYFETLFPKRMEAFPGYKYFYGSIDGGGGDNEVSLNQSQGSNTFGDITLNLHDGSFTPISGTIQNIDRYVRRSSLLEDTFRIIAPNQNNDWNVQTIDARNVYNNVTQQFETRYMATGSVNGIAFERFDSLVGGAADDRFVFDDYVPFKVNPGTGNNTFVLPDYPAIYGTVLFDYALNRDNLIGFQTLEARSPTALSVGDFSTIWDIDGHNAGRVENSITPTGGLQFRGITAVLGAPTALDTVRFHDGGQIDGRLSANGTFQPGKDIVDYSAVTTPVTVSVALSFDNIGDTTGVGGQINGFGVFIGGQSSDTFVADTLHHRWDILGLNRGVINSDAYDGSLYSPFSEGPAQFRFDSFENLVGGHFNDVFRFAPAGDITGTIDRQLSTPGNFYNELFFGLAVVSGVPKPVGRTIDLERFRHVGLVSGSPGVDTLVGPNFNNEWVFGRDNNSVTADGWTTYWDSGSFENVKGGTADDAFHLSRLSTVFPQIDGGSGTGTDVIDLTEMTSTVAVNLQSGVVSFSSTDLNQPVQLNTFGIDHFRGSAVPGSVVTGADTFAVWQLNSPSDWSWNGIIQLEHFDSIVGGSQDDRFRFASESVFLNGSVDGGGGINTIDYSLFTGGSSVWADLQLANGFATNLGPISRIQNVTGGSGDDTVIVYDDGVDHFVDGGAHQAGDTLHYISYGHGIIKTPGGNADHGTVRSGSGATTVFQQIEQFLTDGQQLTGVLETSSSLSDGLLAQGENSIDVRFTQNLAFEFTPQAFQLFRLLDPDGSGTVQEIPVSILVDRISDDRVRLIRINEYGDVVSLGSGQYRLRVFGDALVDVNGSAIDGDGDGTSGGEYVEEFRIPATRISSVPEASSIASAAAANPILNEIVFTYSSAVNGFVQFPNDGIILSIADDFGEFQYVPAHLEFLPDDPMSFRLVPDTQVGFVQAFADGLYRVQLDTTFVTDVTGEPIDGDGDGQPGGDYIRYFRFVNSAPTEITLSNNTVREGLPAGSFIGFLNIQDPDPVDGDQTGFQIFTESPFSAVIYGDRFALVTAEPLSFDQRSTWQTTVTVFDHAGTGFSQSFTIDVTAALLCPPGTYSLTGFLDGSERLADPGFYVPASGATFAIPAPAGTYIPISGATSLDAAIVAPAGYYAPEGSAAPIISPAGFYAPEGSGAPIESPAGYYAPAGSAAPIESPAGYYAPAGSSAPIQSPAGFYAPAGSGAPIESPAGYYAPAGSSAPIQSPAGFYAPAGSGAPIESPAGYYAPAGSSAPIQSPAGFYAPAGSGAPIESPAGYYAPAGSAAPIQSPAGFYSPAGSGAPIESPAGYYAPAGSAAPIESPAGFYAPAGSGAPIESPAGYYAPAGSSAPIQSPSGFYAPAGSGAPIESPAGYYAPAGSSAPIQSPAGFYAPAGSGAPIESPAGFYAPAGSAAPIESPAGFYAPAGSGAPIESPAGYYAPAGSAAPIESPAGFYAPAGSGAPIESPAGYYAPARSAAPIQSPAGFYAPAGSSAPIVVPTGTWSLAGAAVPTLLIMNPISLVYGTPLQNSQLFGNIPVPGQYSYVRGEGHLPEVGTGQIEAVIFTPADSGLFPPVVGTVRVDVTGNNVVEGTNGNDIFSITVTSAGVTVSVSTNGRTSATTQNIPFPAAIHVRGLSGNDTLRIIGTAEADSVVLDSGRIYFGNSVFSYDNVENLTLDSSGGDDQIFVRSRPMENTVLTISGGQGNDIYRFDASEIEGQIVLSETGSGYDLLDFSPTQVSGVSVQLGIATTQMIQPQFTLNLRSGTAFEGVIGSSGNDTITGNSLANELRGEGGSDVLNGGNGNDTLVGGGGDDQLIGGAGNDVYRVDADLDFGNDVFAEQSGVDTVSFVGSTVDIVFSLATTASQMVGSGAVILSSSGDIENLTGGDGNDWLSGNSLSNTLVGGKGDDTLDGGAGNDIYAFDADEVLGRDTLIDSSGTDTLSFTDTTADVFADLGLTSVQTINDGYLTLTLNSSTAFENLTGGSGNDRLSGNAAANVLIGGSGDDLLVGRAGNDTYLFDTDSSLGEDTVAEAPGGGTDTLSFAATTTFSIELNLNSTGLQVVNENLRLWLSDVTLENIVGGSQNDSLTGNSLGNNLTGGSGHDALNGLDGNDTLVGGPGNDLLTGGAGNDRYPLDADVQIGIDTIDESGGGIDTLDFSSTTTLGVVVNLSTAGLQTVNSGLSLILGDSAAIENISGSGQSDILTGNSLSNVIVGNAGNDQLIGAAGGDSLTGSAGDDVLNGGPGDDEYLFDADIVLGVDSIEDSDGTDLLNFSSTTTTGISLDLASGGLQPLNRLLSLTLGNSTVIENVLGTTQDDAILGNHAANLIVGNAGNDLLAGRGGRDILIGGTGIDVIDGGDDDDILIAGRTSYDTLGYSSLVEIQQKWVIPAVLADRVSSIRNSPTGSPTLRPRSTVLKDPGVDQLTGDGGQDWFFRALDDVISDLSVGDLIDLL